jgi:hypothetical protein
VISCEHIELPIHEGAKRASAHLHSSRYCDYVSAGSRPFEYLKAVKQPMLILNGIDDIMIATSTSVHMGVTYMGLGCQPRYVLSELWIG